MRAQLLTADRPTDLLETVRHLTFLQLDPIKAIAPAADLVAWTRLGSAYSPSDLDDALAARRLIELNAYLRPAEDLRLYRAEMAAWPGSGELSDWQVQRQEWVRTNDVCRRDILARLTADGPLTSRDLPDTCVQPWASSGWTNNKNVTKLLDLLAARGEVAVAGRRGRDRLWDLAERVYPDDPVVPAEPAERTREQRRLRAQGIVKTRAPITPGEPVEVGAAGEAATIDGVPGEWRVDPAALDQEFRGRVALLSPFDRLIHHRKRMADLFGFEYQLEMYKPVAQRRWGYYALPILAGDRLVGKLDATADRKAGVLTVHAIHQDEPFDPATRDAVHDEIQSLADWLGLSLTGQIRQ